MIQIFGTKKCFDSKKAERYFKERGVKYQFIDLKEKGMSKGELTAHDSNGLKSRIRPVVEEYSRRQGCPFTAF